MSVPGVSAPRRRVGLRVSSPPLRLVQTFLVKTRHGIFNLKSTSKHREPSQHFWCATIHNRCAEKRVEEIDCRQDRQRSSPLTIYLPGTNKFIREQSAPQPQSPECSPSALDMPGTRRFTPFKARQTMTHVRRVRRRPNKGFPTILNVSVATGARDR
ncbi:hypothetical protein EVAR_53179_1 [Eumeta japonica]|uniref:Uncharacterized protein n=1 Tax=Eumeta variegata TaxID=151549 RepID=A0A4C1YZJ9_EUMVA|nr:hypothetical protein EVAR_53179_1 [Eumeta japonica]